MNLNFLELKVFKLLGYDNTTLKFCHFCHFLVLHKARSKWQIIEKLSFQNNYTLFKGPFLNSNQNNGFMLCILTSFGVLRAPKSWSKPVFC